MSSQRTSKERLPPVATMAFSLVLSRGSSLVLGGIAWFVAARLFSVEAIGQGAAIVGTCAFIANVSALGFDQAIVRRGSTAAGGVHSDLIQSGMTLTPPIALVAGAIAIPIALTPALPESGIGAILAWLTIPLTAAAASGVLLGEAALLSLARPRAIFLCNLTIALTRLAAIGSLAVVSGPIYLAYLVSWAFGVSVVIASLRSHLRVSRLRLLQGVRVLRSQASYALTSYAATMLDVAALSLLPLLILHLAEARTAGIFQVLWLIAASLFVFPTSVARAVFATQSRGVLSDQMRLRVTVITIGLGLVSSIVVIAAAPTLLAFIGRDYVGGSEALSLFGATVGIIAYSSLRASEIRLHGNVAWLVAASFVQLAVLLLGIALLLPGRGVTAIGVAWLVSRSVYALVVTVPAAVRRRAAPEPNE